MPARHDAPSARIAATFTDTGASLAGRLTVVGGTRVSRDAAGTGTYRYLDRVGTMAAITPGLASSRV